MVQLARKKLILAKVESVYNTDPTPTAADNSIAAIDVNLKETFNPIQRDIQLGTMSRKKDADGKRFVEITFSVEMIGSGAAGTAPRTGALFRACAMAETVLSNTSVEYQPTSSSLESCTIYAYLDGKRHIMTGCVGSFKVTATAGNQAMIEFTMRGNYAAPSDQSFPSPTLESTVNSVPIVKSAGLTLNSVALVVNEFTLDMANNVAERPSVNEAQAIKGFHVTDRKPIATIDPESELIATYDYRADILTTTRNLHLNVGSSAGNKCLIDIPAFLVNDIAYGDREQTLIETITGQCAANTDAGDDEVSLLFT